MKSQTYICLALLAALSSCNPLRTDIPETADDRRVRIAAALQSPILTRAPYVPYEDEGTEADSPTSEKPLAAEVWASSASGLFLDEGKDGNGEGTYEVAYHTTALFQSGGPQLLSEVIYSKTDTPPIYFVAMSPGSGWRTTDGTAASFTFSGSEDVMFAPQTEGRYGLKDSEGNAIWPTLHFRHLLTWLKLEIRAESEEVADVWGRIKTVTVRSRNTVTVDLTKEYDPETVISYSGTADMHFHTVDDTDNIYPAEGGEAIPTDGFKEVAYVLCAPVKATVSDEESGLKTDEYIIDISTENRSVEVGIDLKTGEQTWFGESTRGRQFTLSLTFRMGDNITVGAAVEDWTNGGVTGGHFYE